MAATTAELAQNAPPAPAGADAPNPVQKVTAGWLRMAWSNLPFGFINPFIGFLCLAYLNIHFVFAYVGGPLSQLFSKFGTEWIEALGMVPAGAAGGAAVKTVQSAPAGKMLAATIELGEIFVLLVLDAFAALVILLIVGLVGAILHAISNPLDAVKAIVL
ncbi:MAG: hypothetical protein AAB562_02460 [Patescibacteria group bacterium]